MENNGTEKAANTVARPPVSHLHQGWFIATVFLFSLIFGFIGGWLSFISFASKDHKATDSYQQTIIREDEVVADIAEQVGLSVVSISVESRTVDSFFSPSVQTGAGSGVILTEDGLVATNKHVVEGNVINLTAITADDKEYKAEIVDKDVFTDIAFIKLIGAENLKPAVLADSSEVRVGERVIAIGNALGRFENTVTSGIISGIGRPITTGSSRGSSLETLQNLFQTDTAINPGNSGGPLVNMSGEVIGINTAIAGGAENIGFAIPIDDIKFAIESVKKQGRIIRPYLGVRYISINSVIAEELGLTVTEGALLGGGEADSEAILEGGPADKAGFEPGDIILSVNRIKIDRRHNLSNVISQFKVDEKVEFEVLRDGKKIKLEAKLEEAPNSL